MISDHKRRQESRHCTEHNSPVCHVNPPELEGSRLNVVCPRPHNDTYVEGRQYPSVNHVQNAFLSVLPLRFNELRRVIVVEINRFDRW